MRKIDRFFNEIDESKEKGDYTKQKILINEVSNLDYWLMDFRLKVLYRYIEDMHAVWGDYTAVKIFDEVEKERIDDKEKIKDDIEELVREELIILK